MYKLYFQTHSTKIDSVMTVLYNCARFSECKMFMRNYGGVEAIRKFTKLNDSDIKLIAVLYIAHIADEHQSELFKQETSGIKFLIFTFVRAVKAKSKRYAGWSAEELALGFINLNS